MAEDMKCTTCGASLRRPDDQRHCRYFDRDICSYCCRSCRYHRSFSGLWKCLAPRMEDPHQIKRRKAEAELMSARISYNREKRLVDLMKGSNRNPLHIDNQIQKMLIARQRYNRAQEICNTLSQGGN